MDDEKLEREAAKMLFSAPSAAEEAAPKSQAEGPEILFVCPFCNESYHVSIELAGKTINCRNCREPCRVNAIKTEAPKFAFVTFGLGIGLGVVVTFLSVLVLKLLRLI